MPRVIIPRIEIVLPDRESSQTGAPSWEAYGLVPITSDQRSFWPGYRIDFLLRTDMGQMTTRVVGGSGRVGDLNAGSYFCKGMRNWYRGHPGLQAGSVLEAKKLGELDYELSVLRI